MGQTLSAPVTEKHNDQGGNEKYLWAVSEMQGWRINMEDAHTTVLDVDPSEAKTNAFFAVYDGHGGARVAKFSGENVHRRLITEESYIEKRYDEALKRAFLGTDEDIRADPAFFHDPSGCTAVAALLTHDQRIIVANAGDSRSVIGVKGEAKPLSYDHKPTNESERSRIMAAGGYVEYGRVNGNLALSRAIGDFEFKKNYSIAPEQQIITSDPDIIEHQVTDEDEFLILACDGIWDCLSSQQAIDCVRRLIHDGKELTEICEQLMDLCVAPDSNTDGGRGCDNMTIMVIALLNGRTKDEWYAWVKDRVARKYGYDTPQELPQLYHPSQFMAADSRETNGFSGGGIRLGPGGLGGLARVLAGGGISFHPGSSILSDSGSLMFEQDSDEETDSGDEHGRGSGSVGTSFLESLRAPMGTDSTKSLRAQLEELNSEEGEDIDDAEIEHLEENGDEDVAEANSQGHPNSEKFQDVNLRQGEAPKPPKPDDSSHTEQLNSQLPAIDGETPHAAVRMEGLMDTSESPLKA